jgi:hypothetical protein
LRKVHATSAWRFTRGFQEGIADDPEVQDAWRHIKGITVANGKLLVVTGSERNASSPRLFGNKLNLISTTSGLDFHLDQVIILE